MTGWTVLSFTCKENAKAEVISDEWWVCLWTGWAWDSCVIFRCRCQIGTCFHRPKVQIREYRCGDYLPMGNSRNHGHGWDSWAGVVAQLCPTLCDPMDYTVHGILQARMLEWVAFPFARGSSQPRDRTQVSLIAGRFFTSWATKGSPRILEWVAYPFSSGYSRPSNWTRVSCIAGRFFINWAIREALKKMQR